MTEKRDRRIAQTTDLLDAWSSIGWFTRLMFTLAIIACFLWSLKTLIEVALWFHVLLG